jgi:hypothetical protein
MKPATGYNPLCKEMTEEDEEKEERMMMLFELSNSRRHPAQ